MASIKISDLRPAGANLFSDSESYLNDLSEEELGINGGMTPTTIVITIAITVAVTCSPGC